MEQEYFARAGHAVPSGSTSFAPSPLRPSSPTSQGDRGRNPFASPEPSRANSSLDSVSAVGGHATPYLEERGARYFHSRLVKKGDVEKPWLQKKDPKEKWVTILPLIGILVGLAISGFLVWDGIRSVVQHKYCPVLDDDFSSGFNTDVWTKEVQVGGFGNGEFEQTTGGDENVFVENGHLFIKATLQDADLVEKNSVINLLDDGTCTANDWSACVAVTNTTSGNSSIVPPVKSGRINTLKGAKLKYGRVEVTAKLPEGDWLWPAIWMLPTNETYGPWPSSGEIDIMESRGNNHTYGQGGNNIISSALHWGPDSATDAWWKTNNKRQALHTTYSAGFNVFGMEWSDKYIFTYVNSRLLQVLYTNFDRPMWTRGAFPDSTPNGTRVIDIWSQTGNDATPFDQEFFLIIDLAVGGRNGWFEDGKSGKPWLDRSENAPKDFWQARDSWLPTWKQPQIEISRVLIAQQCDGGEL